MRLTSEWIMILFSSICSAYRLRSASRNYSHFTPFFRSSNSIRRIFILSYCRYNYYSAFIWSATSFLCISS